jgi:gamma-glutamylcyclotransferase (GGCT)/AIG2-like uncharacterized protein YtfP
MTHRVFVYGTLKRGYPNNPMLEGCEFLARDARHVASLRKTGWKVFTIWECETRDPSRLARLANRIKAL